MKRFPNLGILAVPESGELFLAGQASLSLQFRDREVFVVPQTPLK
jgi:hypothetical protein